MLVVTLTSDGESDSVVTSYTALIIDNAHK